MAKDKPKIDPNRAVLILMENQNLHRAAILDDDGDIWVLDLKDALLWPAVVGKEQNSEATS